MKAYPLSVGRTLRQFDSNIYAALAGKEPVVVPVEPKRGLYSAIPVRIVHTITECFPVAKAAAMRRLDEAKARVARRAE